MLKVLGPRSEKLRAGAEGSDSADEFAINSLEQEETQDELVALDTTTRQMALQTANTLRETISRSVEAIVSAAMSASEDFIEDEIAQAKKGLDNAGTYVDGTYGQQTPLARSSSVESFASTTDSLFSNESVSSSSTAPEMVAAFQKLLYILITDPALTDLYKEVDVRRSATKFRRSLGSLLELFGGDIQKEACSPNQHRVAAFIRKRARRLAKNITYRIFKAPELRDVEEVAGAAGLEGGSSDDSDSDDEDSDLFAELESFIINSRALANLRASLGRYLGIEIVVADQELIEVYRQRKRQLDELPFSEGQNLVELVEDTNTLADLKQPWSLRLLGYMRASFLPLESPIPPGRSRVSWQCTCGAKLHDDYIELRPGAAKELENFLRKTSYSIVNKATRPWTERVRDGAETVKKVFSSAARRKGKKTLNHTPGLINPELRYYSEARASRTPAQSTAEVFYLLLCHGAGVGGDVVKLLQADICDIHSDKQLFEVLKEEYNILRKRWWSWMSLWTLQTIKFARFELYENLSVNIRQLDEVPPPSRDHEYRHAPSPPDLQPPIGSNLLMHCFIYPEKIGFGKRRLKKIPRRLKGRLAVIQEDQDTIGWGLQFVEGWSKKGLIYAAAVTFGSSSLLVMILVSVIGHNIQNAAAIASFMLSLVTIGIAMLQAALHMP